MNELNSQAFAEYFGTLFQDRDGAPLKPMAWQQKLCDAACAGEWPEYICVPTGAGKTSSIDIAIFALAVQANLPPDQRTASMRTFLVVDRRTVVSEAFHRASYLKRKLDTAENGVLKIVADRLRSYTDGKPGSGPLAVYEMRGGIYRQRNWCSSLTQPMIVTSTIDQVGSRLLFRGYGVSPLARPIQAAAVAHDSLIILDEAHISPAFAETLSYVRHYQQVRWSKVATATPLRIVQMTATPPEELSVNKLEIHATELNDPSTHIGRLVNTAKPTSLVIAENVKGNKAPLQIAAALVEQVFKFDMQFDVEPSSPSEPTLLTQKITDDVKVERLKVIGIMCNTVATAKATVDAILKRKQIDAKQVHMVIGAMRPIDRDVQTRELRRTISTGTDRSIITKPIFVVSTQCIEVGADYDFDVLVTEAAPLDSLIQRFGRLNRAGRSVQSQACVVMRSDQIKTDAELAEDEDSSKFADLIYGNATCFTWNWLKSKASENKIDFGISALKTLTSEISRPKRLQMSVGKTNAPVLLPAHLDLLCQTSQEVWPDPDVALWLHGPQRSDPEIQVCWRADLLDPARQTNRSDNSLTVSLAMLCDKARQPDLIQALSMCPPSSPECLSVSMRRVFSWLTALSKGKPVEADLTGDLPQISDDTSVQKLSIPIPARPIVWRGLENSFVASSIDQIRPGDTLVFTSFAGGWTELGYVPKLHGWNIHDANGNLVSEQWPTLDDREVPTLNVSRADFERVTTIDVASRAFSQTQNRLIIRLHPNLTSESSCNTFFEALSDGQNVQFRKQQVKELLVELPIELTEGFDKVRASVLRVEYYANRIGIVVSGPSPNENVDVVFPEEDGSDGYSLIAAGQPIELADHLQRVRDEVARTSKLLALSKLLSTIVTSGEIHDWGKADERFQALLLGGDTFAAVWEEKLYAKSSTLPTTLEERDAALEKSKLPKRFRHEMLSLAIAEHYVKHLMDVEDSELLLHLVASHHGYARPWAPVCNDDNPPDCSLTAIGLSDFSLTHSQRRSCCYHRIDSSVPSRFWKMTRKYGWWGTVLLEAVLRVADHRVSQLESIHQLREANRRPQTILESFI